MNKSEDMVNRLLLISEEFKKEIDLKGKKEVVSITTKKLTGFSGEKGGGPTQIIYNIKGKKIAAFNITRVGTEFENDMNGVTFRNVNDAKKYALDNVKQFLNLK